MVCSDVAVEALNGNGSVNCCGCIGVVFDLNMAPSVRTALLWGITQRQMVTLYQCSGTAYWSHLQGASPFLFVLVFLTLEVGLICCPETLVKVCHLTLHNTPEACSSHQRHGISLKSWPLRVL
jgi:hypothetical protein